VKLKSDISTVDRRAVSKIPSELFVSAPLSVCSLQQPTVQVATVRQDNVAFFYQSRVLIVASHRPARFVILHAGSRSLQESQSASSSICFSFIKTPRNHKI
jgi:hypothetical protein